MFPAIEPSDSGWFSLHERRHHVTIATAVPNHNDLSPLGREKQIFVKPIGKALKVLPDQGHYRRWVITSSVQVYEWRRLEWAQKVPGSFK
jgi:hypothetical protein